MLMPRLGQQFAPPDPLSPEELSLRIWNLAVADGYLP
jgi:hypothetical protein